MKNILTNTSNILKRTLIISLYFCFPYLKTTNTTKTIQKKEKGRVCGSGETTDSKDKQK